MEMRTDTIDGICPLIIAQNLKELHEDPDTSEEDIEKFRQNVLDIAGLHSRQDNSFLLRFLRARKFDQERSLTLLKDYYKIRLNNTELFQFMRPSLLRHGFEDNIHTMLNGRDRLGRRVVLFRVEHWDPNKCSIDELLACFMMYLEIISEEEATQICGISSIVDCKGVSFQHCRQASIATLRKMAHISEKAFPARFKTMHIVNENFFCRTIITIGKTILSKKLSDRIHVHGNNFTKLHELIDPSILPSELGGELPPMDSMETYKSLLKSEEYFENVSKYGYELA